MTIVEATRSVVGGIDTHGEVHVAAALDGIGGLLGSESFGANPAGYESLVVYDNGPGIPAEAREEAFLPGRRLPGAHPDGSGMGLSIVRRIVEYYGGQVFVDPNVRSGTAIVFSLPAVQSS